MTPLSSSTLGNVLWITMLPALGFLSDCAERVNRSPLDVGSKVLVAPRPKGDVASKQQ